MESHYFAQLPTNLLLSKDLSCFQKLLYADIQSLTFQKGYCWASNDFLAERHSKSKEHISRQLAKLVAEGHLFIIDSEGGKQHRKIFTESTFLIYAKQMGLDVNSYLDKNIKVKDVPLDKNINVNNSNIITTEVNEELPKGNSGQGPQGSNNNLGSKKRTLLKQQNHTLHKKDTNVAKIKRPLPETVELLEYWNSFDTLTTHTLKYKRKVSPLNDQSKTIQKINTIVSKVLSGSFYSKHEIPNAFKNKKFSVAEIKKMIDKLAIASGIDYSTSKSRPRFELFFFNAHIASDDNKKNMRFKYPFLHYLNNEPVKVADTPTRKKTEYSILVDRTLSMLSGTIKPTDRQYNQTVTQVEKAVAFLKKVSNGNFAENRMKLPSMLKETMIEEQLELSVDYLPLGVYNLEKYMKKRSLIRG